MFQKLTAIEPIGLIPEAQQELSQYTKELVFYRDIPAGEEEILRRIGDSDGVLVSYTTAISGKVIKQCPNLRYIGMCCSLYSEESANVDIACARQNGIQVYGIRDYGDKGVVEYVLCELIRMLHGYGRPMWQDAPLEITGLKAGIIGLGVSGTMIAQALRFLGADVHYYSRTRKPERELEGIPFLPLHELLQKCDVLCTCLNKNVILLQQEEFSIMGNHKILFNTSIGPSFREDSLAEWLDAGENFFFCDTWGALGGEGSPLANHPHVYCAGASAGRTKQASILLSKKVLENIKRYMEET